MIIALLCQGDVLRQGRISEKQQNRGQWEAWLHHSTHNGAIVILYRFECQPFIQIQTQLLPPLNSKQEVGLHRHQKCYYDHNTPWPRVFWHLKIMSILEPGCRNLLPFKHKSISVVYHRRWVLRPGSQSAMEGWGKCSVQDSQVLPHQTGKTSSLQSCMALITWSIVMLKQGRFFAQMLPQKWYRVLFKITWYVVAVKNAFTGTI